MFGIIDFWIFFIAAVVVNVTPGQDTFYIIGRSISQGRSAGVASVMGIGSGVIIHTLAAALGLSALLAASANAFFLLKMVGAIYLIYLGICMMLNRSEEHTFSNQFGSSGFWQIYCQGLWTNVLNPKVAIFFLAFMPQFISPQTSSSFFSFLVLGACFVTTGTLWCTIVALAAASIGDKLKGNKSFSVILNRLAGLLFVFLGLRLSKA